MRPESTTPPPRRPSRRLSRGARGILLAVAVGLFALLLSVRGISNFSTEYLWFDGLGFDSVWRGVLFAKIVLAVIFIAFFAMLCWVNLWLADRLAPQYREASPEEEAVARFRELIGRRWGLVRMAITMLFAISVGAAAASQWRNWLLFTNSVPFGIEDPQFGRDISFFVFRMPFLQFVASWLFTALMVVLVLTIAMHYLAGGIRIQSLTERVTPQVKAHVSVLLAVMALVRAASYWLDRFALSYSTDGKFAGLGYTDVKARLPVLNLLILIALLSVVLFVVNIRRRGWGLPAVAVGLWALVSIVMGGIYPLVVQRFSVNPDETTKEAPYVARNIAATKEGFGLAAADERVFVYDENVSGADVQGSERNLASVPLLEPGLVAKNFELEQTVRSFFRFDAEADVDRYVIDDVPTQVVVSARELNSGGIPESGWESEVLSFTHGNGIALAPVNRIVDNGPVFLIGGVPLDNRIADEVPVEQPRIYFGESMTGYAIANSDRNEVDSFDGTGARVAHRYEGTGGVASGGFWRRAMFALRFQSIDPLISDFVRDDSRFIWYRNVGERVRKVAPFLEFDHNPYPVVVNGRVLYVIDGYTTTDNYPYSNPRVSRDVQSGSDLRSSFNYVRNSVKATVDAYDGTVTLYVVDQVDPIIEVWRRAFPDIFTDVGDMPAELVDHLRYAEDMFVVQTNMWAKYHLDVEQSDDFLEGSSQWSVAQDPGGVSATGQTEEVDALGVVTSSENRVDPYYTLLQLPDENQQEFVIMRTFVSFSNDDTVKLLKSFMVGVSEIGSQNYGRLVSYEVENTDGDEVPGPALVAAQILTQDNISERISLLNAEAQGSSVEFGDLIMVPVQVECSALAGDDQADTGPGCHALLWVRPMYVIARDSERPSIESIVVSYGERVVMCRTLAASVQALFGVNVRTLTADEGDSECIGNVVFRAGASSGSTTSPDADDESEDEAQDPGEASSSAEESVEAGEGTAEQALELLLEAQEALEAGDLGRYQELVEAAREQLAQSVDG